LHHAALASKTAQSLALTQAILTRLKEFTGSTRPALRPWRAVAQRLKYLESQSQKVMKQLMSPD
jgi:hypothetical protein